jgi:hypothetical protein
VKNFATVLPAWHASAVSRQAPTLSPIHPVVWAGPCLLSLSYRLLPVWILAIVGALDRRALTGLEAIRVMLLASVICLIVPTA